MSAIAHIQPNRNPAIDPLVLRAAVDACPEALAVAEDGRIAYTNIAFARTFRAANGLGLLGRTLDELEPGTIGDAHSAVKISSERFSANGRDCLVVSARAATSPGLPDAELRRSQSLEAVGRLVGGVVHDFNNLLTGVVLCCDLLLAKLGKKSPLRHYAQEMRTAGAQGAVLIEQLMAVVRQSQVEPALLSWNEVIGDMQHLLARMIGENIELSAELGGNLRLVKMDVAGAQQIILNLVLNARDAMPDGGQISLSTRNCVPGPLVVEEAASGDPAGPWIELEVADTGCGMDKEVRTRIFEPFFTTKEAGQGTGLGLATVKSIVKQYHGTIDVNSEPGEGTRITVGFPGVQAGETNGTPRQRGAII